MLFHDGQKVVCLDAATGDESGRPSQPRNAAETVPFNFGPKLVIYQAHLVLFAGGDRLMAGLSESGKELWSAPHDNRLSVARKTYWSRAGGGGPLPLGPRTRACSRAATRVPVK